MASLVHNEATALEFLTDLTRAFTTSSVERKQLLANLLLEEIKQTPIAEIEGPSYMVQGFWDHLQNLELDGVQAP